METAAVVISAILVLICGTGAFLLGQTKMDSKYIRQRQYDLAESLSKLQGDVKGNGDSLHSRVGQVLSIAQSNVKRIDDVKKDIETIDKRVDTLSSRVDRITLP